MPNPVDEYLESVGGSKTASFMSEARGAAGQVFSGGNIGGHVASAALVGGLGYVLPRATDKIYRAITKTRDFRSMMEANPGLQIAMDRDPAMFNRHFTSLRNMAPEFTADPVVAGTYMRRISDNPDGAGTMILEAAAMRPGHGSVSWDSKTKSPTTEGGPQHHESNIKYQPAGGFGKARR